MASLDKWKAAAQRQVHQGRISTETRLDITSLSTDDQIYLSQLREMFDVPSQGDLTELLVQAYVIEASLRQYPEQIKEKGDAASIEWLYSWATEALYPPPSILPQSEYEEPPSSEVIARDLNHFKNLSYLALSILSHLDRISPIPKHPAHAPSVITTLALFTSESDSWTTTSTVQAASSILERHADFIKTQAPTILITHALRGVIRPLFSTSRPNPSITPQARKAISPLPQRGYSTLTELQAPTPWKTSRLPSLNLLAFVLRNLTPTLLEENWPLLIPPILTLLDDSSIPIKARACNLLTSLLERTPPSLLARTGLGDVFQEALLPCLTFLPTLTPVDESLQLLSAAYPALFALANARYPPSSSKPAPKGILSTTKPATTRTFQKPTPDPSRDRDRFLSLVLRSGILAGYTHVPDSVRIVTLLLEQLRVLATLLGTPCVKHLQHVLPMMSDVLAQPFGSAYLPLLVAAAKALQAVILVGWPRMARWRGEVLRGVAVCWVKIGEDIEGKAEGESVGREDSQVVGLGVVQKELKVATKLLYAAIKEEVLEIDVELDELIQADERVAGLFDDVR